MNSAVVQAINCIWVRYSESLSLADIAQSAVLSRFHFSRVFKAETGISPGQYLAAVRIYQAKRLLVTGSMSVADISVAVGYNSLGSFTNHFTDSVGISPSRFRRDTHAGCAELLDPSPDSAGVVAGALRVPEAYVGARVYLGVFDTQILQRRPKSVTRLDVRSSRPHPYRLGGIPDGRWFVHAVAMADTNEPEPWTRRHLLVGGGPVRISAGTGTAAPISLRPHGLTDLPILLALPDLEAELVLQQAAYARPPMRRSGSL